MWQSEETSLVDVSRIVGREGDKETLLVKLLGNESCDQDVTVVSLVGLGGIGKTTLAQVLYNHEKVKGHFELMSWVCVSDDFDVFKISKAIYKDVGGEDIVFETLNQLQVALLQKLSHKRFLLVLDDVWNEDYRVWECLQRSFAKGSPGSKIIVTTRKTMVASVMESIQAYPLEPLSNEEALSLFAQHALGKRNFDSHPTLKMHGECIMKKCGGLPLALVILGRVLRTKANHEEWEELSNSEIWNLQNENKILPALKLSYYDLPPHLKQMFAYCCLFPKDYLFEKDELVLLWMAEGFLYKSNDIKKMERLGRDYFEELESRLFFQHSTNHKSRYTMHDVVSDLAMSVAGEFFVMLDEKIKVDDMNEALENLRHLSFIRKKYGVFKKFEPLVGARRLRTFLAMSTSLDTSHMCYLSNKVLMDLVTKLQLLRVLKLDNFNIKEVPQSISNLKHMRYLNFSNTDITYLPEQVGDLYNLQSMLVSHCHDLSSLPNSIVKLINLRHLDISDTPKLNKMPLGIEGLTGLQTLSKVIIGGANEFKISDLKGLLYLEGQLSIKGLHRVRNAAHSKEANLHQKTGIRDLEMHWSDVFDGSRNKIVEYEVFERLRPFEKLTSLKILFYMGTKFPSWLGDSSFVCLTQLTLRGCISCTCLPTVGNLPLLQKLFLESLNGLRKLGSELLGHANSYNGIAFPSLEVLGFRDMQGWEEWSIGGGDNYGTIGWFPCLCEISLIECPKLDLVAIHLIPSLQVLHVEGCSMVVIRSMVSVSSSILRLTMKNIKGLTQLHSEILECLWAVEILSILQCDELTYVFESEAKACKILVSLNRLYVMGCKNLMSLVKRKMNLEISMKSIREVVINDCPKLKNDYCPSSIEKLRISNCNSITSLPLPPTQNVPSTLKMLELWNCACLDGNWLFSNFLSLLGSLVLLNIPNVSLFPEGCLIHLTQLTMYGCDKIEAIPKSGFGFLPLRCLRSLLITDCKNLKSFPHELFQSLTSLEYICICTCPSMDYSFPSGVWPPNLAYLAVGGLMKPMSVWGMQNFPTSLVHLQLYGDNSGVVTFANADEDIQNSSNNNTSSLSYFLLPSSLPSLHLRYFDELESVSKGLEHLTCLEEFEIYRCPKLRDLPETLLPSLSCLLMSRASPELRKKCTSRITRRRSKTSKGKYWPIISQIPRLEIEE